MIKNNGDHIQLYFTTKIDALSQLKIYFNEEHKLLLKNKELLAIYRDLDKYKDAESVNYMLFLPNVIVEITKQPRIKKIREDEFSNLPVQHIYLN